MGHLYILLFLSFLTLSSSNHTYLVYLNPNLKPSPHPTHLTWLTSHLISLSINPSTSILYSYPSLLPSLFSLHLLPHHLPLLLSSSSNLLLLQDSLLSLDTTRSPSFLHLPPLSQNSSTSLSDVVIGVLDTGIWPEHPSFLSSSNFPPVPHRWKGECESGVDFHPNLCNGKLIGARSFLKGAAANGLVPKTESTSARDVEGHGTHTASIAAGSVVMNAGLFGYADGVARGMAPSARVAAYKVCWSFGCYSSDILAGIDRAVADGVDILSLSLSLRFVPANFLHDPIAVGTFAAVQNGVFVACSAGNTGPARSSVSNTYPWITTVGAGTLDRNFPAYVSLASGKRYAGVSLYSGSGIGKDDITLVYITTTNASKLCLPGSLTPNLVKGKIVFCDRGVNDRVEKGLVVRDAGGVGMILANKVAGGEDLVADSHLLPAVAVGMKAGDEIREYVVKEKDAKAVLSFDGTVLNVRPSPVVAAFSSRGPNVVTPEILKPDLIAPGVNILAGWSGAVGPTGLAKDHRRTEFNIVSGTSMSCPHVSGIAALLKSAHPSWSPAAIKSALMTTAYTVDNTNSPLLDAATNTPATPNSFGSGHVNPTKALSPGLVYNITTADYISFLCAVGSTDAQVQAIAKDPNVTCAKKMSSPGNLNYPSFSVVFNRQKTLVKYVREVTNVGSARSVYAVRHGGPDGVTVTVRPARLVFKKVGEKLRYTVTFVSKKKKKKKRGLGFGWIEWFNEEHQVRSPVSYSWRKYIVQAT